MSDGLPKGVDDIGKMDIYKNDHVNEKESGSASHEAKLEREGNPPVLDFVIPGKYENPGEVPIAGHDNPGDTGFNSPAGGFEKWDTHEIKGV